MKAIYKGEEWDVLSNENGVAVIKRNGTMTCIESHAIKIIETKILENKKENASPLFRKK